MIAGESALCARPAWVRNVSVHLPIRVNVAGHDKPLIRTYTLSSAPSDAHYRISVKREGMVSGHLHDNLNVGDTLEARAPAGDFSLLPDIKRPMVLMAGGIGITPMMSMMHGVHDGGETQFLIDDEIKGVLPLPNRIIGFDANLLHRATSFRDNHRFTLAAKFSSLPTEILKEKYPFLY